MGQEIWYVHQKFTKTATLLEYSLVITYTNILLHTMLSIRNLYKCHIPEDNNHNSHHYENVKSHSAGT